MSVQLSIIVPFHKGLPLLKRVLEALGPLRPGDELIIAADGAQEECGALAAAHGAHVVAISGPRGPAVARNVAAASASGDVLVFVDADVVASTAALARVVELLDSQPELSAVFGSYDEDPFAPGFVSQYKNLAHAYIHQSSCVLAQTFWAGFGAIRRSAFMAVGGFDERFERPSIEDIDLGYRLTGAGHRILLDPSLAVCHLKRWTFMSMLKSDVLDRGIPWTQLILRYRRFGSDLNVRHAHRVSVAVAYLALAAAILALRDGRLAGAVLVLLGALACLNLDFYRFLWQKRGAWFVSRAFPLHVLYYLYNGFSLLTGTALFLAVRHLDIRLPGALPAYAVSPLPGASSPDAGVSPSQG